MAAGALLLPLLHPADSQAQVRRMSRTAAVKTPNGTTVVKTPKTSTPVRGRRVHSLPAGYKTVYRGGVRYYYVGGIYYRPMMESGATVYVVVDL